MTKFHKQIATLSLCWFLFFLFTQFALGYSHWEIPGINIANYYFYFLIFLISLCISLYEKYYPIVYAIFALIALVFVFGFAVNFMGPGYYFDDYVLQYKCWGCRKMAIYTLIFLNIAYISISQIARSLNRLVRLLISLVLSLLVAAYFFRNLLLDTSLLVNAEVINRLLRSGISIEALSIGLIGIYGISYYLKGKPFSSHINFLIVGMFVFLLVDIYDNNYAIIREDPPIFSQIVLLVNLVYFILVLGHKLYFMQSPYGSFWDMAVQRGGVFRFDIIPKLGIMEKWVLNLSKRIKLMNSLIASLVAIVISWFILFKFFPTEYTIASLIIIIFCLLVLLFYLSYLARKKLSGKFRITKRKDDGEKNKLLTN